jgi:hypothetical protein
MLLGEQPIDLATKAPARLSGSWAAISVVKSAKRLDTLA